MAGSVASSDQANSDPGVGASVFPLASGQRSWAWAPEPEGMDSKHRCTHCYPVITNTFLHLPKFHYFLWKNENNNFIIALVKY